MNQDSQSESNASQSFASDRDSYNPTLRQIKLSEDQQQVYGIDFLQIITLGCGYTLIWASLLTSQITSVMFFQQFGYGKLGSICLIVFFLVYAIVSIFSASFAHAVNSKWLLMLSSILVSGYSIASVITCDCRTTQYRESTCDYNAIYSISIVLSFLSAIGTSVLWVSSNRYIEDICRRCGTKSFVYCSTFYGLSAFSMLIGIIVFSILYYSYDLDATYNANLLLSVIGVVILALLPFSMESDKPNSFRPQIYSPGEAAREFLRLLTNQNNYGFYIVMIGKGICSAFYLAFIWNLVSVAFSKNELSQQGQNKTTLMVLLTCGGFKILGFLVSLAAALNNSSMVVYFLIYASMSMQFCCFLALCANFTFSTTCVYVAAALIGFADQMFIFLLFYLWVVHYQKKIQIHAIFNFITSICVILLVAFNLVDIPQFYYIVISLFTGLIVNQAAGLLEYKPIHPIIKGE